MNITITPEQIYMGLALFLMGMQIHQFRRQDRIKKEIEKLWDQIATFNTMVAIKLLENQKEINKLQETKKD
jgi:hypothetical protein